MYKRFKCKIPMNIQLFADAPEGNAQTPPAGGAGGDGTSSQTPQFDYEKLANLIAGKQSVTEESLLTGYIKQQG